MTPGKSNFPGINVAVITAEELVSELVKKKKKDRSQG